VATTNEAARRREGVARGSLTTSRTRDGLVDAVAHSHDSWRLPRAPYAHPNAGTGQTTWRGFDEDKRLAEHLGEQQLMRCEVVVKVGWGAQHKLVVEVLKRTHERAEVTLIHQARHQYENGVLVTPWVGLLRHVQDLRVSLPLSSAMKDYNPIK